MKVLRIVLYKYVSETEEAIICFETMEEVNLLSIKDDIEVFSEFFVSTKTNKVYRDLKSFDDGIEITNKPLLFAMFNSLKSFASRQNEYLLLMNSFTSLMQNVGFMRYVIIEKQQHV